MRVIFLDLLAEGKGAKRWRRGCRAPEAAATVRLMIDGSARTPLRALSVALLGLAVAGCATVKPSQRKYLSKPEMTPAMDAPEDIQHAHIDAARRGGLGGHGGAGGGCGCG